MENQKDIEALKYSLSLKLEIFNKIRYGYDTLKEEVSFNDIKDPLITEECEIIDSLEKTLEKDLVLVDENIDEYREQNKNSTERKSAMNLSNLGTSYFGRKRR